MMRFSAFTPPRDSPHPRSRQRNADQLHHHLIIPSITATPTAPLTTVGNATTPSAWDPGVHHPHRQRRTNTAVPLTLPPHSPSPPSPRPTTGDARKNCQHPGSYSASFSEDGDTEIDIGNGDGEEDTDDEYEVAGGHPDFVPGSYSRSAREVAPRFSNPHNLRAHHPGVNSTRISAQSVCHFLLLFVFPVCPGHSCNLAPNY